MDEHERRPKKGLFAGLLELLGEDAEEVQWEQRPAPAPVEERKPTDRVHEPEPEPDPSPEPSMPTPSAPLETEPPQRAPEPPQATAPDPPPSTTHVEPGTAYQTPSPTRSPSDPRVSRLSSPITEERKQALRELAGDRLDSDMLQVVAELVLDPELDLRLEALDILQRHGTAVGLDAFRRGLQDPTDEVRAKTAQILAARGQESLAELATLVGLRRWPRSQRTALDALPDLIETGGIDDEALAHLLASVARLDSPSVGDERQAFERIARAVGRSRLEAALTASDERRLGAARLLVEDGSPEALEAAAQLIDDDTDEVRVIAALAQSLLPRGTRVAEPRPAIPTPDNGRPAGSSPAAPVHTGPSHSTGREIVAGLARTLVDPDEGVRQRARDALEKADPATIEAWARSALQGEDQSEAEAAAQIVEALRFDRLASDLLDRAIRAPAGSRRPFEEALTHLELEPAALVEMARRVDAARRPEALRVLRRVCGASIVEHLTPFLADSAGPIRMAALEIAGESSDPDVARVALRTLETDSSPAVRATAVKLLARADTDQRLQALNKTITDPDPDVRATAVEVLLEGIAPQASQLLLQAVDDPDPRVQMAALHHLVTLPPKDAPVLWAALRHCPTPQRDELLGVLEQQGAERLAALATTHLDATNAADRALALEIAARAGTPECAERTIQALRDPAPSVRRTAARALSVLRTPDAIPALTSALKDPNPKVRLEVVHALGVIDDDGVIPGLISALKDPEVRVRDEAATVLLRWSSRGVASQLVDALAQPHLARAAGELLERMGSPAVEPLVEALIDGPEEIIPVVGRLLDRVVGPNNFLEELSSLDPAERLRCVQVLGAMGGPRVVDGLIRALSDPDERIRIRALQHLGRIGDPRAYEAVRRTFAGDPVLEVAEAAEATLRLLEDSDQGRTEPQT